MQLCKSKFGRRGAACDQFIFSLDGRKRTTTTTTITTTAAFKGYFSQVFFFFHDGSGEDMCARPTRTDGTAIILLFLPDFRKPARRLVNGGRAGARGPVAPPNSFPPPPDSRKWGGSTERTVGGNGRLLLITAAAVRRRVVGGVIFYDT